jgi:hypothetical protein
MHKWVWPAFCAAGVLLAGGSAQAGFLYPFDIDINAATCNGGLSCSNDDTLDTFQAPHILATDYDLKFHTSAVSGVDVAYGGADDPDGLGEMSFTALHGKYVAIYTFELIPIAAGTYTVNVNGFDRIVGPGGLTIQGGNSNNGAPLTIRWDHDDVVGITNIQGVVPEPASWAMMLVGFFGLGAALRTRRTAIAPR